MEFYLILLTFFTRINLTLNKLNYLSFVFK